MAIEGSCRSDQLHLGQAIFTESQRDSLAHLSHNGTEGMRRKTSLQLHGTGPVALIEAVRKFPNH